MPNTGDRIARMSEQNNQPQGRTGGKCMIHTGPAVSGDTSGNPTKNGGINRSTNPTSQR